MQNKGKFSVNISVVVLKQNKGQCNVHIIYVVVVRQNKGQFNVNRPVVVLGQTRCQFRLNRSVDSMTLYIIG